MKNNYRLPWRASACFAAYLVLSAVAFSAPEQGAAPVAPAAAPVAPAPAIPAPVIPAPAAPAPVTPPRGGSAAALPPVSPSGTVVLNFGDQVDIRLVVDYVAARTKTNFIYDETLTGTVSLRAPKEVPVSALTSILESVLEFKGWALAPSPEGFIKVVPAAVAATKPTPFFGPDQVGQLPDRDVIVTQVVALKNADSASVMSALQGMTAGARSAAAGPRGAPGAVAIAGGSKIYAVPGQRMLVLTDYATNIARMLKMIEVLDVPAEPPQMQLIVLENIRADEYAQRITAYMQARNSLDPAAAARKFTVDADPRLNALVVVAMQEDLDAISDLATRLDVPVPEAERPYRIIKLKNTNAEEMLETVQQLMGAAASTTTSAGKPAAGTPQAITIPPRANYSPTTPASTITPSASSATAAASAEGSPAAGGASTNVASLAGGQVTVIANRHANALILVGPPREQAMLAAIIDQLDMRRPQVMIEALVVEVNRSHNFDIGVELLNLQKGAIRGATSFDLSKIDFSNATVAIPQANGLTGFLINGGDVQAIVRLFEQKGNGRIVSRPRALVNDNEPALFRSEQEAPYTQISSLSANTTTVSFADYAKAGISLSVTPHISEADYLQLEITVNLSAFTGDAPSSSEPPPRSTNYVQSKVTIPDNCTILIGGLNQANDTNTRRQVPLLGSIPLIGRLFRRDTSNKDQATLYVFIKSRIARADDFADIKGISDDAARQVIIEENQNRPKSRQLPTDQDIFESPATAGAAGGK